MEEKQIEEKETNRNVEVAPALIAVHPNQNSVAVAIGSDLRVYDLLGDCAVSLPDDSSPPFHKDSIRAIRYGANGKLFVSAGDDKVVKIWSAESWKCISAVCSEKRVSAVAISNDGQHVCFADKFGVVWVVDLRDINGNQAVVDKKAAPLLAHYCSIITSLEFSPDGQFIISADRDFKIRVTVFPKGPLDGAHEIQSFCLGHTEFVSCLDFVCTVDYPQGYLVSGSGDSTVRLWDIISGSLLDTCEVGAKVVSIKGENFVPTNLGSSSSSGLLWMVTGAANLPRFDHPSASRVKVISGFKKSSSPEAVEANVLEDDDIPGGVKMLEKLQGSASVEEKVFVTVAEAVKTAMCNLLIKKQYSVEKREFRKSTRNDKKIKQ
ncbi:tRNA (guanine-N(7)-)-methyltransferase non-catalytic subunit [Citrus sinensis]|nr:tRNA (guanine-N(7)-)-methyltransferase non-catalytic subunit [Citrus sinensis]KAH9785805.1 tRNA (guanine-N(7)-)-methyltransferase non-catalytic subunit [Citrus sinensis]